MTTERDEKAALGARVGAAGFPIQVKDRTPCTSLTPNRSFAFFLANRMPVGPLIPRCGGFETALVQSGLLSIVSIDVGIRWTD